MAYRIAGLRPEFQSATGALVEDTTPRFHRALWTRYIDVCGLICVGSVSIWAQTRDLTTTDDGSKLYFSSTLRMKGTGEYTNGKIFEYASGSYTLIKQVMPSTTLPDGTSFQFAYRMPTVSGDGSILAYDGTASCTDGPSCKGSFTTVGVTIGALLPDAGVNPGSVRISHNGRYAVRFGGESSILAQYAELYDFVAGGYVNNLHSGIELQCGGTPCTVVGDGRQSLTDDGALLTAQGLWLNGQVSAVGTLSREIASRISPDGKVIVTEFAVSSQCYGDEAFGYCNYNNALVAYNVATGVEVQLAKSPAYQQNQVSFQGQPYFFPTVSNDGRFVLYRAGTAPQLILSTTDGASQFQITNDSSGIAEGTLSGDARHAYAVSQDGALLSIAVDSGGVQTILSGGVPTITKISGAMVPGSLVTLTGTNLFAPDGQSRLGFSGSRPPIVSSTANSVTVQIPWELDTTQLLTVSGSNPDSPFEQAASFQPVPAAPAFLAVMHADFTPLNTYSNFASPGENLVVYMTGLGSVSPSVATGQTAPPEPLSYTQFPLDCIWDPRDRGGHAAVIQFSGLAPGTVGVYQVNLLAPTNTPASNLTSHVLTCASVLPSGALSSSATTNVFVSMAQ